MPTKTENLEKRVETLERLVVEIVELCKKFSEVNDKNLQLFELIQVSLQRMEK